MKVILYMATSLDGYIARSNDETPWSDAGWDQYYKAVNDAGCLILGRKTYEIMQTEGFEDFTSLKLILVVTSGVSSVGDARVKFVDSPEAALAEVERATYETVIVGGGSQLNRAFLRAGLINEVQVDIEPILLGDGIKLLENDAEYKLRKKLVTELGEGVTHLEYEVMK